MAKLTVEDIKPFIGSRVEIARPDLFDAETVTQLRALLEKRGVLVFPGLNLSDEEQIAFTDLFGERVSFTEKVPGGKAAGEGVYKITLDPTINDNPGYVLGTFFWHMDGVVADDIPPPKATLLSGRSLSKSGGDTEFASTKAAYGALSEEEKAEIEGLHVVHSVDAAVRMIIEDGKEWTGPHTQKTHPLVWKRQSGERSLVIGSTADRVVELPLAHGRALLTRLLEWTARPEFTYRHQWSPGDFVIWDNCGTLHRVVPYEASSGRSMHRTSTAGLETVQ